MKTTLTIIGVFLITGIIISSCKKNSPNPKTDEEINLALLSKTWILKQEANAVTISGTEVSDRWLDFELTFGDRAYSTVSSDADEVWPVSGSWTFGADANTLVRDDGVEVSIVVTESSMIMNFNYTLSGGRISAIGGDWVFNMVPK